MFAKKKGTLLVIALLMAMALMVVGCGESTTNEQPNEQQQAVEPKGEIILATTTSTQDSGLLDDLLLPIFQEQTGYTVKTIAVGTGQALEMGTRGDADVLLTHAPASEKPLVEDETVINYQLVMHNDYVLLGPDSDPAQVKDTASITDALKNIADAQAIFVSRGDDSGTDKAEKKLWVETEIDPKGQAWYHETGQGMGASITIANEKQAYILSDRGTYLAQSTNIDLVIVSEGDEALKNIYHVMQVNPEKFDNIKADGAKAFVEFMIDQDTQEAIKDFGTEEFGQPLFFPDRLTE